MSRTIALHLSLIQGIGSAIIEKIISKLEGHSFAELHGLNSKDWNAFFGIPISVAQRLVTGLADKKILDEELERIEKYDIAWVTILDKEYPLLLRNIYLPPTVLYWRGRSPSSYTRCLAVVGSRKANSYCDRVAQLLLTSLLPDWCIVSGGALGADTIAHELALEHNGQTIAVIGSGLLKPYPPQNKALFAALEEREGTLLSPFGLLTPPLPGNFPARNRVIAGLSMGCLVLQAAARSGALITAAYALEQGREVFAVPGSIDDELSAGCHGLIAQGAHLVSQTADILAAFGLQQSSGLLPTTSVTSKENIRRINQEIIDARDPEETTILRLCAKPISFDDLCEKTSIESSCLCEKLFTLQLSGMIEQNIMGFWQAL